MDFIGFYAVFMLPMPSMETSIHRRRRILLHFFLGIGLPSLLLGYLAFRGIQNDIALLEKEQLNEHNKIAQQVTNSINDKISALEAAFLDSVANHQAPQQDSDVLRSLERLKSRQPLVEEVFLFESAEHIRLPLAKLLFLPKTLDYKVFLHVNQLKHELCSEYLFRGIIYENGVGLRYR